MEVYKETSDAIVLAGHGQQMSVLLISRKYPPYQDHLAFPGGFLESGEDPLAACLRELQEETGLVLDRNQAIPLVCRQKKGRDPRGLTRTYPYLFWLPQIQQVKAADDAILAKWVPLNQLKTLAFDHGAILCEALGLFWPQMPTFNSSFQNIELPSLFAPPCCQDEIFFFGGSFNPWHEGHQECIRQVKKKFDTSVVIVPDSSPWKDQTHPCYFSSYRTLCLLQQENEHVVYPGFWGLEVVNPTIDWINKMHVSVNLVIGDDNFLAFQKWKSWQEILAVLKRLIVIPRQGKMEELQALKEKLEPLGATEICLLDSHPFASLSSTLLRQK